MPSVQSGCWHGEPREAHRLSRDFVIRQFLEVIIAKFNPLKIDLDFSNKHSTPTDEKANAKKQSLLFRLFNTLLGYSNTEKCFTIPPARLRYSKLVYTSSRLFFLFRKSAVCNAFLSGLPEILDLNLIIGNQLLPTVVQLLMHLPSPQKLASDQNVSNYSLKLLSAHMRHLWLNSFILILYKVWTLI